MNIIEIPQNIVDGQNVLTQEALDTPNAIYIIKHDFVIKKSIKLYNGCELRVEDGSITGGKIFLPVENESNDSKFDYGMLSIGECYDPDNSQAGEQKPFFADGCFIKSKRPNHFDIFVNTECRIMLGEHYNYSERATLHLMSNKVNSIQIDGKCGYQIHAENCRFQRIFECPDGWSFVNRLPNNVDYNIFENCIIWADDYAKEEKTDSAFLALVAGVSSNKPNNTPSTTESLNWLIMRNCIIDNLGLDGSVDVDNCNFLFGSNTNDNYETIHCGNHSRIRNSYFDGCYSTKKVELTADVIDVYNRHNIIIEGCTFTGYMANTDGRNIITIKSHYYYPNPPENNEWDNTSDIRGAQHRVIVRNCYFDLDDYIGSIIVVWNGPFVTELDKYIGDKDDNGLNKTDIERREYNRRFTLIENNYVNANRSPCFVNCLAFADNVTVRNNMCCVRYIVSVADGYRQEKTGEDVNKPQKADDDKIRVNFYTKSHDLVIEGNTIFGKVIEELGGVTSTGPGNILYGSHIDNIVLSNNRTGGYIWLGLRNQNLANITGVVRICDNETNDVRGLFGNREITVIPEDIKIFFSGNISRGHKTDMGSMNVADSPNDGILFTGRRFYCTEGANAGKLLVFNGSDWQII